MPTFSEDDTAFEVLRNLVRLEWQGWDTHQWPSPQMIEQIVEGQEVGLSERQTALTDRLKELLSTEEWARLPELVRKISNGEVFKLESDRIRALEADRLAQAARWEAEERDCQEQERDRQKQEQLAAIEARKQLALQQLEDLFESDFLSAVHRFLSFQDAELISEESYWERRIRFIQGWAQRELDLVLDADQARAVATTEGNVRVVARAGAGKTRTLVTRALFLQQHCGVSPRSMLLLAFNKKAAKEMKDRLSEVLGDDLPHVMTFHALAYALVHPEETLIYDRVERAQLAQSRAIQTVIDDHIRSPEHGWTIRESMLAHFRADWERLTTEGFDLSIEDFLAHRRALQSVSLNGDYVKSFGEKVIANALFEHGVPYKYERNFHWNGINYRPDFTIETGEQAGIAIEYFGLAGTPNYDEQAAAKRAFWADKESWTLLEFTPSDLISNGEEGFVDLLRSRLDELGVESDRLSEEQIWSLVENRVIDNFTRAMTVFVGRCRNSNISADGLRVKIGQHRSSSKAEELFLQAAVLIYSAYLEHLHEAGKEDFDGLMWRATERVQGGQKRFSRDRGNEQGDLASIRFLMIDEYQDFSEMFFSLIEATRATNPDLEIFCVGDDWQAINAFAGSDLKFFERFEDFFDDVSFLELTTNYRSGTELVKATNALMEGLGSPSAPARNEPGKVRICAFDDFVPNAIENATHQHGRFAPALLRLITGLIADGQNPVLVSRQNRTPWPVPIDRRPVRIDRRWVSDLDSVLEYLRSCLPEDDRKRVSISTTHKYKGLEERAVIVVDALDRRYPLIHPNWIFQRIFGDSLEKIVIEERRLFYVSLTRAIDTLLICTEWDRESAFLEETRTRCPIDELNWEGLRPAPSIDGPRVEIRVSGNNYPVRNLLNDRGYTIWTQEYLSWSRVALEEGLDTQALLREPWYSRAVLIEVYREDRGLAWSSA